MSLLSSGGIRNELPAAHGNKSALRGVSLSLPPMNSAAERPLPPSRAFVLLLLLAAVLPVHAEGRKEAKLPGSPLGKLAAAYLQAFNSGSRDALREFISANYSEPALQERSAEARAEQQWTLVNSSGPLDVFRAEQPSGDALQVWARARRTGEWLRLRFAPETAEPLRIPGIVFESTTCPRWAECPARLKDAQVVAELRSYLDTLTAADAFSGVVLLARDGTPIFEHAYGNALFGIPIQTTSRFALASMNKMFTAVAVAQLAESGKLSFQDPIRKYLPEYPRKITEKITIHHLLTHTSGLPPYLVRGELEQIHAATVQDYLPAFFSRPLLFEPGERWSYSNAGFLTLDAIVERVSGQSFSEYLEQHIFAPAGMSHSVQGISTVEDLLKFANALRQDKLLGPKFTSKLLEGKVETDGGDGSRYAYGFLEEEVNGQRIVGHGGSAPGWNGQLDIYRESGYTVVVLANRDSPTAHRVAVHLRDLLTRR